MFRAVHFACMFQSVVLRQHAMRVLPVHHHSPGFTLDVTNFACASDWQTSPVAEYHSGQRLPST